MRNSVGTWPYKDCGSTWPRLQEWTEISEQHYWQLLEAVPPRYFCGVAFVGEESDATSRGVPIHCALIYKGGRYFVREIALDTLTVRGALLELSAELEAAP